MKIIGNTSGLHRIFGSWKIRISAYLPQPEIAVSYSYDSELMAAYAKMQYRMPQQQPCHRASDSGREKPDYNVVDLHQMTEQYQILIIPGEIVMDHEQENTVREFIKMAVRQL